MVSGGCSASDGCNASGGRGASGGRSASGLSSRVVVKTFIGTIQSTSMVEICSPRD
jgi:hypothetical protein